MILEIILTLIMICITMIALFVIIKIIIHERVRNHDKEQYLNYLKHLGEIYGKRNSWE
jgi:type II secretory pathway pseudopilin PulG